MWLKKVQPWDIGSASIAFLKDCLGLFEDPLSFHDRQ